MKEAIISKGPKVSIIDSPVPKAGKNQIVTKVIYSGSNPKDWKRPEWTGLEINQGDDIAGIVHEVGENVYEFKKGDRVAAFHEMGTPHGSYAEYAVSWKHTTFHLPEHTSFEEGAALPLAALTAAIGLYDHDRLNLPQPWAATKDGTKNPLLVYGGSSAVGTYVLQLAVRSDIHPLIVVAGKAASHVEKFIDRSKGDTIVDYRKGDEAVQQGIKDALQGERLLYAYDAVTEGSSLANIAGVLDPHGAVTFVLPFEEFKGFPASVHRSQTRVGDVHGKSAELGFVYTQYIARGLDEGWFKAQPQKVVPGGLTGVEQALKDLKDGKASAVKYIFKIADTPGAAAN